MLAELVKAGKLPPVEERLPDVPVVVEPTDTIGKHGGTWRRLAVSRYDTLMLSRLGYESLVRWDRTGRNIVPCVAKSWDILDDGSTYVFYLRKGMKWSDGEPFTAAAYTFWYDDIAGDKFLLPVFPHWFSKGDNPLKITAPDKYTVIFSFKKPNSVFLEALCHRGHFIVYPGHYLKQFHAKYADEEEIRRKADEKKLGLTQWDQIFWQMADLHGNPELPTIRPWRIKVAPPALRLVCERNPYYWKVDTEGNQLPYIDAISFAMVQDRQILNFRAMTGTVDMQARHIDAANYTMFMRERYREGRRKSYNYEVIADTAPVATCIFLNQYSKDPNARTLLCDRRFRIALSLAINREEIIEFVYGGTAESTNGVSNPFDPYYVPGMDKRHTEYDPDRANRLLGEVGLRRGRRGLRLMPDGSRFRQILYLHPSETGTGVGLWELVAKYWRDVGLDFSIKPLSSSLSYMRVENGNTNFWAYCIGESNFAVASGWYVPIKDGAFFAPMYGRYYARKGRSGVQPSREFERIYDWFTEFVSAAEEERKMELGRKILKQWSEECYVIGIARPVGLTLVSNRFKNFGGPAIHDWISQFPGYLIPEQFWIEED